VCITCPSLTISFFSTIDFVSAWAKDEPHSPTESFLALPVSSPQGGSRPASRSDARSYSSSGHPDSEHRWFPFARRRQDGFIPVDPAPPSAPADTTIHPPADGRHHPTFIVDDDDEPSASTSTAQPTPAKFRGWGLHINLPTPAPNTMAQSKTPGWNSPWVPKPLDPPAFLETLPQNAEKPAELTLWKRFRKRTRRYLLNNIYVPLVRRSFTCRRKTLNLLVAFPIYQYHPYSRCACHCRPATDH
jgi:hypothetical protein